MCDPLTIAGIALSVGSMVANNVAETKTTNARNAVLAAESSRQQNLDRQVDTLNTQSQERYVDYVPQQEQRATELADMYASNVDDPSVGSVLPSSSSSIVNQETDNQMGQAQQYVDQQTGALADMRSFGDLLGSKSLLQARDAAKVGQIGSFKQGSQAVTPYELDNANKAGDGMKLFGDVLRMGGSVLTGAGINGGSIANMFGGGAAAGAGGAGASLNASKIWGL